MPPNHKVTIRQLTDTKVSIKKYWPRKLRQKVRFLNHGIIT